MSQIARKVAIVFLAAVAFASLAAGWITPHSYDQQDRNHPNEKPSKTYPLGTDELGRDRMARVLYGTRVSLLLAPAAALIATLLAAIIGGVAGLMGGATDRAILAIVDVVISMPWFFLLLMARAALPLNTPPLVSVVMTFLLLGLLGWAQAARLVRSAVAGIRESSYVLLARSLGISESGILWKHVLPNARPVLVAQFWISIPLFIVAEANLGLLGLGVSEPMPSLGGMLRELESLHNLSRTPWIVVPALVLLLTVGCLRTAVGREARA